GFCALACDDEVVARTHQNGTGNDPPKAVVEHVVAAPRIHGVDPLYRAAIDDHVVAEAGCVNALIASADNGAPVDDRLDRGRRDAANLDAILGTIDGSKVSNDVVVEGNSNAIVSTT